MPTSSLVRVAEQMACRGIGIDDLPVGPDRVDRVRMALQQLLEQLRIVLDPVHAIGLLAGRPGETRHGICSLYRTRERMDSQSDTDEGRNASLKGGATAARYPARPNGPTSAWPRCSARGSAPARTAPWRGASRIAPRRWPGIRATWPLKTPFGLMGTPRRFPRALPGAMLSRPLWGHWGQPSGYGVFYRRSPANRRQGVPGSWPEWYQRSRPLFPLSVRHY